MKSEFRLTRGLLEQIRRDLHRPHEFASERVGFVMCRFGRTKDNGLIILAHSYEAVADENYIPDDNFGALIDSSAFRHALQILLDHKVGLFHIHLHDHSGEPHPGRTDLLETKKFVPDFFNVSPGIPHGALILSRDSISGRIWYGRDLEPVCIDHLTIVGMPLQTVRAPLELAS